MSKETILDDMDEAIKLLVKQSDTTAELFGLVFDALHYHEDRIKALESKKGSKSE